MANGNGYVPDGDVKVGMTVDEKLDSLLEGLVDIRTRMDYGEEKMEELAQQNNEILEKLNEIGSDTGLGYEIEEYDS